MATESRSSGLTFTASPYATGVFGVWCEFTNELVSPPNVEYDWAFDSCDLNEAQATTLAASMSRKFSDFHSIDWDWVYRTGMAIGACDNCASEDFGDCPSCHLSTGFGCGHGAICDACDDFEKTGSEINERLDFERIREIAEEAARAAVRSVQAELGIEGDGIASIHFDDETWSELRSIMQEYAVAELKSEEGGEA